MRKLFGTDGIRGIVNEYPMTADMVMQIGKAIARVFINKAGKHRILIGRDTRLSGTMIESALAAGICSMGVDVLSVSVLPTPAVAFLTVDRMTDAGIMISASHNPFQDNGLKIFSGDGLKLPDLTEEKIEKLIGSYEITSTGSKNKDVGQVIHVAGAEGTYIGYLKKTFPKSVSLRGLKIVLDCANGAGYRIAPIVFGKLGAEVIPIHAKPDGTNINLACGAMHPEVISSAVKKHRADIGIALDGDADRVIFSDEKGKSVDGDHIMAICALDMKERRRLKQNTVVATVMSNMGFDLAMQRAGIRVIKTQVGDRYILGTMLREGYNLGGEQSGHLIFLDHSPTGDGILSALQVLAIMKRKGKPLSELSKVMTTFPQVMVNVDVKTRKDLQAIPEIKQAIDHAEKKMKGKGRVLVRFSGTQLICRVMVEGPSKKEITELADAVASLIGKHLG